MISARALLLTLVLALPSCAEPVGELTHALQARLGTAMSSHPSATWGESVAAQDLQSLRAPLARLEQIFQSPAYSAADLDSLASQLGAARRRIHMSSSMTSSTGLEPDIQRLEERLRSVDAAFDGKALPAPAALAKLDVNGPPGLPYFNSPNELLREARGIRYGLNDIRNPVGIGRGGAGLGISSFDASQDLRALSDAAYEYEFACRTPYPQVLETYKAYCRVVEAYNRLGYYQAGYDSSGFRNLARSLDRLKAFYAAVK